MSFKGVLFSIFSSGGHLVTVEWNHFDNFGTGPWDDISVKLF